MSMSSLSASDVLEAVCAVLLLLMGMGLKVIFQTLKEIMQQQRVCNDRFADRARNDTAHKHFYDELERLNVRVSLLERDEG